MSDIIDDANETADLMLSVALRNARALVSPPAFCDKCLNCGADTYSGLTYAGESDPNMRWCDADCRDDWEKSNA